MSNNDINKIKEIIISEKGLEELKKELYTRINIERELIKERLKSARADGDLSENADYNSAREEQGKNESRIQELEIIISGAVIIEDQKQRKNINLKEVRVGSWVKLLKINNNKNFLNLEQNFKIVGSIENNPFKGLISNECPLALSIMNCVAGDIVDIKGIKETYKVKIIEVKNIL